MLSDDLLNLIFSFLIEPQHKIFIWIKADYSDWQYLSAHPNASQLLKKDLNKVDWNLLSQTSSTYELDYLPIENAVNDFKKIIKKMN